MFIVWTSDQTASPRTTGSPRTSQGCILKSLEDFRSKIKNFTRNCKFLRKVQILRENLKEILGPSHPRQFLVLSWTTRISFLKKTKGCKLFFQPNTIFMVFEFHMFSSKSFPSGVSMKLWWKAHQEVATRLVLGSPRDPFGQARGAS